MKQFSGLAQQQAGVTSSQRKTESDEKLDSSKLEQVIEGIQALRKDVQAGNKRRWGRPWIGGRGGNQTGGNTRQDSSGQGQNQQKNSHEQQEGQAGNKQLNHKKSSTRGQLKTVLLKTPK